LIIISIKLVESAGDIYNGAPFQTLVNILRRSHRRKWKLNLFQLRKSGFLLRNI